MLHDGENHHATLSAYHVNCNSFIVIITIIIIIIIVMTFVVAVVLAKLSRVNVNRTAGVLTAEFRNFRLHKCGLWNRTIARTFRQGRHSLLMTLYTTVDCSTNYIRQADEGLEYFIAIRRPWRFHAYNYYLRRGDKVIRRGRRSI